MSFQTKPRLLHQRCRQNLNFEMSAIGVTNASKSHTPQLLKYGLG